MALHLHQWLSETIRNSLKVHDLVLKGSVPQSNMSPPFNLNLYDVIHFATSSLNNSKMTCGNQCRKSERITCTIILLLRHFVKPPNPLHYHRYIGPLRVFFFKKIAYHTCKFCFKC